MHKVSTIAVGKEQVFAFSCTKVYYAVLLRVQDLFCKSRHCGSCRLPLSRQVHSVGQCQGGGRLYGRGEPLLIWRAAKTYQGLRRLSRGHVSFRVKAFQDILPTKSWHIRHRLKMTNNIYQQRLIWKFRKCLAQLVFFLVNWSRDETI